VRRHEWARNPSRLRSRAAKSHGTTVSNGTFFRVALDRTASPARIPPVEVSTPLPIHPVRDDSPSDAVTTYFEQLARVPLLTREGEVTLAQRIEEGERRALRAIVASPVGARELAALGRSVRSRKLRLRDITRATVDEDGAEEETRAVAAIADALEWAGNSKK